MAKRIPQFNEIEWTSVGHRLTKDSTYYYYISKDNKWYCCREDHCDFGRTEDTITIFPLCKKSFFQKLKDKFCRK